MGANEQGKGAEKYRRFLVPVTVVIVTTLLLGAFFLYRSTEERKHPAPETANPSEAVGLVDMAQAMQAHADWQKLLALMATRDAIAADITKLQAMQRVLTAPPLAEEPFAMEAAVQAGQDLRTKEEELKKARGKAMEAWDAEKRPAFVKEQRDIEADYRMRMVNLEMQLDNSKAMRLTKEEQDVAQKELDTLRAERGNRIRAVWDDFQKQRTAYEQTLVQKDVETLEAARQDQQAMAMQAQNAAQKRNTEALQTELKGFEPSVLIQRKEAALQAKDEEIRLLKAHMRRDIESQTARLALLHHLTLVLTKDGVQKTSLVHDEGGLHMEFPSLSTYAADAVDLTAELLKAMEEAQAKTLMQDAPQEQS